MINFIEGLLLGLAIGGVVAIFVYRNNKKKIDKVADKVDNIVEAVKK
jgi:hypothetical protein